MGITTPGIGSGLDINGLVTKLMDAERKPVAQLNSQRQSTNAKLSNYGILKGALSALQSAAQTLSTPAGFSNNTVAVSDPKILSASVGSAVQPGSFEIEVRSVAQAQQVSTGDAFTSSSTSIGQGLLRIAVGDKTTDLQIGSDASDLAGIRNAINAAGAGLSATIIQGDAAARLFITSNDTGTKNSFSITNPGGGLESLTSAFSQVRAGSDAVLQVNGATVTSSSNTITSAVSGLTLTALAAQPGVTTTVTVAKDPASAKTNIQAFADAFNKLNSSLNTMAAYDPATKSAGPLNGESVVRRLQGQLSQLISAPVSNGSGLTRLADIGLTRSKDGSLAVDAKALDSLLANPASAVADLFMARNGSDGLASRINTEIGRMLAPGGLVATRADGLTQALRDIGKQIDDTNARLALVETRYRKQFNQLDSMLASMNSTSSFLQRQLDNLGTLSEKK